MYLLFVKPNENKILSKANVFKVLGFYAVGSLLLLIAQMICGDSTKFWYDQCGVLPASIKYISWILFALSAVNLLLLGLYKLIDLLPRHK